MEIRQQISIVKLVSFVVLFILPISVHSRPELPLLGKIKPDCISEGRTFCTEVSGYPEEKIKQSLLNASDDLLRFFGNDIEMKRARRSADFFPKMDAFSQSEDIIGKTNFKNGAKLLDILTHPVQ